MENEDFLRSTGHGREERHEDTRKLVSSRDDSHQEHNLIIRSKVSQLSFFFLQFKTNYMPYMHMHKSILYSLT